MSGGSKLFRTRAWTEDGAVAFGEDVLMAWHDCRRIIAWLGLLSKQHGVTWRLRIDNASFGRVTPEGPDAALAASMRDLLVSASAALDVGEDRVPGEVTRILARYPPPG